MMMNPNILNRTPLMFFDRAVNAQRSQLLTVMADAVSECRTAADQAAELNETGQVGLLRLAEVWSTIRAKEGMGGLVLEGTEAKILSDVVAQFYAYLSGCMFNDPVGMAIYAELHYMMDGSFLDPLRKFGGWLFLVLKGQLRGLFSGIRVDDRLPDLFLCDIGLRLICSGRSFLRFTDRLFQRRVRPFLISKAQARLLIQTILPA